VASARAEVEAGGDKRLGWLATYVFYGLNGHHLEAPDDAAYDLISAVASGQASYREAAATLAEWVVPLDE
jgi:death on curing protein